MKTMPPQNQSLQLLLTSIGILFLASAAQAQWLQTANGTYDYNTAANWSSGNINGVFPSTLVLPASTTQNITFSANSTLSTGLTFTQNASAASTTLRFMGSGANRTITLGGDLIYSPTSGVSTTSVIIGSATAGQNLNVALGADRVITSNSAGSFGFINDVSGAFSITKLGSQSLNFAGATTFSGNLSVQDGAVWLAAQGTLGGVSAINLGGLYNGSANALALLRLENRAGSLNASVANLSNRVNDSAVVNALGAGQFVFTGAAANAAETIGTFNNINGLNFVNSLLEGNPNTGVNSANLTISNLARTTGSQMIVGGGGRNSMTSLSNLYLGQGTVAGLARIQLTQINGGAVSSALQNGILPWMAVGDSSRLVYAFATNASNGLKAYGLNGTGAVNDNGGTEVYGTSIAGGNATSNVRITASEALVADATVNSLTVAGTSAWSVSAASARTLTIASGGLIAGNPANNVSGNFSSNITLDFNGKEANIFANYLTTFQGKLNNNGGNGLNLSSAATGVRSGIILDLASGSTITGPIRINNGDVLFTANVPVADLYIAANGFLTTSSATSTTSIGALSGEGVVRGSNAGNAGTRTLQLGNGNGSATFMGTIQDGDATKLTALEKVGTGSQTLSGNNSYTGGTTVSAGTLRLSGAGTLGTGEISISGGTLDMGGKSLTNTLGNLTSGTISNGTLTNNGANFNVQSGTISAALAGTNGVNKTTIGTVTLSGNNTYTGATTINAGTILLNGANALSSSTSLLSAASGSTISLADGVGRTITLSTGNLSLSSATMVFELGSTSDRLTLTSGGVTLSGTNTITLVNLGSFTAGNYTLISAATGLDTGGTWSLNSLGGPGGFTYSLTSNATTLTLSAALSSNNFYWTGNASANWSGDNFSASDGGASTLSGGNLSATSDLIFAATGVTNNLSTTMSSDYTANTLVITTPGVSIGSSNTLTLNSTSSSAMAVSATSGNATIGVNLAGAAAGLAKTNSGTLILSGNNTYAGTTTVSGGVLNIQHNNALGGTANGTTVATGASLQLQGGITVGAEALSLSGTGVSADGALRNISGDNTYGGEITLSATTRINSDFGLLTLTGGINGAQGLTIGGAGNTAISNAIATSTGTLTKDGLGTLTLSGNNTYTGVTTISAGTLVIGAAGRLGGGNYSTTITNNGSLVHSGTSNQILSGVMSGNGTLIQNGPGNLTLSAINTYTGGTTVNSGTLNLAAGGGNAAILGTLTINSGALVNCTAQNAFGFNIGASLSQVVINGGTLNFAAGGRTGLLTNMTLVGGNVTSTAGGALGFSTGFGITTNASATSSTINSTITIRSSSNMAINVADGAAVNDLVISGVINNSDEPNGSLTKTGAGTLLLSGNNTYNGTTTVSAGTLRLSGAGTLGTGEISISGGTLDMGGKSLTNTFGSLSGGTLSNGTLTNNGSNFNLQNGAVSAVLAGTNGVNKTTSGTVTLTGNNTYTGTTTINSGTLQAAAAGAMGNSTVVNVTGGSFLVTAANAVSDNTNINLNGGRMAMSGNFNENVGLLTLSADSIIDFAGFSGVLRFSGVGSWAASANLAIWNWSGLTGYNDPINNYQTPSRLVFTNNATLSDNLANISFYSGNGTGFVGNGFERAFSDPGFSGTEIIAVPEPETYLTGIALLAAFGIYKLRSLRRKGFAKSSASSMTPFQARKAFHDRIEN